MIQRNVTIDVHTTPEEAADEFSEWDHEAQARFMNRVAANAVGWNRNQQTQWLYMSQDLDEDAKRMIRSMADILEG